MTLRKHPTFFWFDPEVVWIVFLGVEASLLLVALMSFNRLSYIIHGLRLFSSILFWYQGMVCCKFEIFAFALVVTSHASLL